MSSLGVIVARGGSRRIPRKVLQSVAGTPLLAWCARAARQSRLQRIVLSTDDEEIAALGRSEGIEVPFMRPAALAGDFVCNDDVVLHAMAALDAEFDIAVLLQPTVPFMLPAHIDACLDSVEAGEAACCFAAKPVREPPQWMFTQAADGALSLLMGGALAGDRQHTQKLAPHLLPAGAIWAIRSATLKTTGRIYSEPLRAVTMEPERAVDIDEPEDLAVAEAYARQFGFAPFAEAANVD